MNSHRPWFLGSLLVLAACAPNAQDDNSQSELGSGNSRHALRHLESVEYHSTGFSDPHLEGFTPDDTGPSLPRTYFERDVAHDLEEDLMRLDYETNSPGPGFVTNRTEIIREDLGAYIGTDLFGQPLTAMSSDRVSATRRHLRLLNPLTMLQEIAEDSSLATHLGQQAFQGRNYRAIAMQQPDSAPVTLLFRGSTLRYALTQDADVLLGDVSLVVHYDDWQRVARGLRMPHTVSMTLAGHEIHFEERSAVTINSSDEDDFEFPDDVEPTFDDELARIGAAQTSYYHIFPPGLSYPDARPAAIMPVELSPGVFFLTGTVHNSMLIEQSDGLILVEAPSYPARAEAILEWAASQFPSKQITHVVTTHHHVDHTGGVRTLVATGATLVVGESSKAFFENTLTRPATLVPDRLSTVDDFEANVLGVSKLAPLLLDDERNPVIASPIANAHADDMLVAYLPNSAALFNSDLFSPGFPATSAETEILANNLYDFIVESDFDVQLLPSGHGFVSTIEELRSKVQAP